MKVTIEDLKKLNFDGDRENMVMTTIDRKEIESYFENDADALDEIENIENVALTIHAHADYDTGFATGFAYGYGAYEGRDLDTPNEDDFEGVIEWLKR